MNILFSSAGRRVGLINCFRQSASDLGEPLRVVATDLNTELSPACRSADLSIGVPPVNDPGFIDRMLEICEAEDVRIVVPTIDPELSHWARAADRFASIGTRVVISEESIVALARDKLATSRLLLENGLEAPRSGTIQEVTEDPDSWHWPLIAKPVDGSGSRGIVHLEKPADLSQLDSSSSTLFVQELISGREYTVNMYFDRDGKFGCAVPHWRVEVRAGEVSKGITERHPELASVAERLGGVLKGASGPLCFQAIVRPDGTAVVFEINARFGGGYPLAHQAGAPFARWLLEEVLERPSTVCNDWRDDLVMLRFDDAIYFPRKGQ